MTRNDITNYKDLIMLTLASAPVASVAYYYDKWVLGGRALAMYPPRKQKIVKDTASLGNAVLTFYWSAAWFVFG